MEKEQWHSQQTAASKGSEQEKLHPRETQALRSFCVMELESSRVHRQPGHQGHLQRARKIMLRVWAVFLSGIETYQNVFRQPRLSSSINSVRKITQLYEQKKQDVGVVV